MEFKARSMTSTSFIFSSRRDKRALSASNICISVEMSPKSSRFLRSSSNKEFRSYNRFIKFRVSNIDKLFHFKQIQNTLSLNVYQVLNHVLTSDHLFWELAKAFFSASTSRLSLKIVDSLVLGFDGVIWPTDAVTPILSLVFAVWSTAVFDGTEQVVVPIAGDEGDPEGVGVEITDSLDPPLWCPEDEDGVCDLIGEYCWSGDVAGAPRENFSFDLVDVGGLGGSPSPTPVLLSFDLNDSSKWKWTECGDEEISIPAFATSSSDASKKRKCLYYWGSIVLCTNIHNHR